MDGESRVMREMGWLVSEEVNRDKSDEADGMNLEVDSKDKVTVGWEDCLQNDILMCWVGRQTLLYHTILSWVAVLSDIRATDTQLYNMPIV